MREGQVHFLLHLTVYSQSVSKYDSRVNVCNYQAMAPKCRAAVLACICSSWIMLLHFQLHSALHFYKSNSLSSDLLSSFAILVILFKL